MSSRSQAWVARTKTWCRATSATVLAASSLMMACARDYSGMPAALPDAGPTQKRDAGSTTEPSTGDQYSCTPRATDSDCTICLDDSCCQEKGELQNDGKPLWDCLVACKTLNDACIDRCTTRFPQDAPLLAQWAACSSDNCHAECSSN